MLDNCFQESIVPVALNTVAMRVNSVITIGHSQKKATSPELYRKRINHVKDVYIINHCLCALQD